MICRCSRIVESISGRMELLPIEETVEFLEGAI